MSDLLADFLIESDEKLAEAWQAALRLQHAPGDPAALSPVFRIVHTVKGTCGFLGLRRLEQALHSTETLLGQARDGALPVTPEVITAVLNALDHARLVVAGAKAGPDALRQPDGATRTRMQPIGRAWAALPWVVQNLAGQLGKQVDLVARGHDAPLDRNLVRPIRDALTHMVRNSVDHGIEAPAERAAAGKPHRGRITLDARRDGDGILVELGDDGRGLDTGRIRARALRCGLATEGEIAAMPDAQVQRFIFRAGFSTVLAVTASSGRGVGLDVASTNVERARGAIDVSSRPGRGTTITIRLPDAPGADGQCRPPRAVIGQTHSTRPARTPTYQS